MIEMFKSRHEADRSHAGLAWILLGTLVVSGLALANQDDGETAEASIPKAIPEAARQVKNPVANSQTSVDNGMLIFSSQCVMCHGPKGDGAGFLAKRLKLSMPDFTSRATQTKRTDGEYFYIITNGHGRMPGEGDRFEDETKWSLVNAIRAMAEND
ncbi:MAG: cytochrome c [bacterium]|nr:cytochrome c [bacterium]